MVWKNHPWVSELYTNQILIFGWYVKVREYIERFDFFVLGQDVHKTANLGFGHEPNWLLRGGG